ncbi:SHOCT domain-containing protein [Rhodosalinus sp. FB01]|uniref:SHOCT domain-containing protein n=1 Tax=Rhodosalinus sp. FB01 TaxID=3239194 RepID=UPI0035261B19
MEDSIGFFDLIWSIFLLFMLAAWIWVLISVVADIFRSQDMGGVAKALWIGFVIIIPWLGVLVYIVVRGDRMHENTVDAIARAEEARRDYIRSVAQVSPADELSKLAELKEKGILTDDEFVTQKSRILSA